MLTEIGNGRINCLTFRFERRFMGNLLKRVKTEGIRVGDQFKTEYTNDAGSIGFLISTVVATTKNQGEEDSFIEVIDRRFMPKEYTTGLDFEAADCKCIYHLSVFETEEHCPKELYDLLPGPAFKAYRKYIKSVWGN